MLQGSIVLGVAMVSSSTISDVDTTHLWHMRLGHMSERGIIVLKKHGLLCDKKKHGSWTFVSIVSSGSST